MIGRAINGISTEYPSSHRMNTGVVFIGASWYSGSTLLGLMLGADSSIFYAGETNKFELFDNPSAPLKKRVCRLCGPGCLVWGDLRVESGEDLYEALSQRTRRPIVFDSTKDVRWIKHQVTALREVVPLRLVVLIRDGRAVVNSLMRKWPEASVRAHATWWVERMRSVEELASHWPGSVHRVRYEELVSQPESALRALADFVGVAFDPVMLNPWGTAQHPLGGNDGPLLLVLREGASGGAGVVDPDDATRDWYGAHPPATVLDLRWKHEMSGDALAVFEEVAYEANRGYAWKEPVE